MIFKKSKHAINLYNILLTLSRNLFFYKNVNLPDVFETRIYLMFIHFSILLKVYKKRNKKFDQQTYDYFFHNIEYNLRELGFGDVSVNKKMKDLNKIFYDILLKIDANNSSQVFQINYSLVVKYFNEFDGKNPLIYEQFEDYFSKFYDFCFELPLDNMLRDAINFKY